MVEVHSVIGLSLCLHCEQSTQTTALATEGEGGNNNTEKHYVEKREKGPGRAKQCSSCHTAPK